MLLGPTQSSSLFLQQLGRGPHHHPHKATCVVLDVIGHHRAEFRFNLTCAALTGLPTQKHRNQLTTSKFTAVVAALAVTSSYHCRTHRE